MRQVYADNAATTAVSPAVLEAMLPFYTQNYGNPSSLYSQGAKARAAIDAARETIAHCLGAAPNEIYFTSGGSESDNWAIQGIAQKLKATGKNHIITTAFEHHAVLHPCKRLEKEGFAVTYLPVHEDGLVHVPELAAAITDRTALVTIMYANNEIGTIQPIAALGALCREKGVLFHTDAVQAVGSVPIDVQQQSIDLLSLSAHKLHGPKGVGALYIRNGVSLPNLIEGGAQERGKRAGTENVAGIVGLAKAMEIACATMSEKAQRLTPLRDKLIDGLLTIESSRLNGHPEKRLPGNVNLCFAGVEGESLLLMLDMQGIAASSGSACTSGDLDPSHVLLALGLPHAIAHGSLRLSLSTQTDEADIAYILEVLPPIIARLRMMSPLWNPLDTDTNRKEDNHGIQ